MKLYQGMPLLWAFHACVTWAAMPNGTAVEEAEIIAVNAKLLASRSYFEAVWRETFRQRGMQYAAPSLKPYRRLIRTECGVAVSGNAFYCPPANTIYYDELFVTEQASEVSAALRSDGAFAAVTILSHEMGHAARHWIDRDPHGPLVAGRPSYATESEADCFAGAVVRQAEKDGRLRAGDRAEARQAILQGGDGPGGKKSHGTPVERVQNFDRGYQQGAAGCNTHLNPAWDQVRRFDPSEKAHWENRVSFTDLVGPDGRPGQSPVAKR